MLKSKTLTILFILIIVIAFFLRFYKLGAVPEGLFIDESSEGYSAYSILKTGKDEYGKRLPIIFRSLGDFKTPIYIYLIVPFIYLMDLTPLTVRFPSAFFGFLTIPLLYLFMNEILSKGFKWRKEISLLSSFFLAISPWHILFSRTASESNVSVFLFLSSILFFFKGLKRSIFLIPSFALFALTFTTYHSQRLLVPITLIFLATRYKKKLLNKSHVRSLILGSVLLFVISLPTILISSTPGFSARAQRVSIVNNIESLSQNKFENLFLISKKFISNYFGYLSPKTMFITGDPDPGNSLPGIATFYLWQLPFYIIGLVFVFKSKEINNLKFVVLLILLISPIAPALTRDHYSSIRSLPLLIPQIIITSFGIYSFSQTIGRNKKLLNSLIKKFIFASTIILFTGSIFKTYNTVFIQHNYQRAEYWDYGWKELTQEIDKIDKSHSIIVDTDRSFDYYHILFFMKYDPDRFVSENFEVNSNEYYKNLNKVNEKKIDNFVFREIEWEKDTKVDQYLVGTSETITEDKIKSHKLYLISEIYYPNRKIVFRIVKTK